MFRRLPVLLAFFVSILAFAETPEFIPTLEKKFNGNFKDLANRAIVIYDENCLPCLESLGDARDAVAKLTETDKNWEKGFVWLARKRDGAMVNRILKTYLGNKIDFKKTQYLFVDEKEVVRKFQTGCQEPLDQWAMSWLYKGINEMPEGTQPIEEVDRYPLTGHWWSVDGDWAPTRAKVIEHLLEAPLHTGRFEDWWLALVSYDELQSVHSDHHRELQGTGKVKWEYVNKHY